MNSEKKIYRILIVSTSGEMIGGVERYIQTAAHLLREAGVIVDALFENEKVNPTFANIFRNVYKRIEMPTIINTPYDMVYIHKITDVALLHRLNSFFKTHVMIHDHDFYCPRHHYYTPFGTNCHRAASFFPCELCAGLSRKGPPNYLHFSALLKELKECTSYSVASEYMRDNLVRNNFDPKKIFLVIPPIPPKTDLVPRHTRKGFERLIVFAGQIIRGKGLDLLLHAMTQVDHSCKLRVCGRGNALNENRRLAKFLKIDDRVEFLEYVPEMDRVYAQADLLIAPSRWQEPYGLIGREAMRYALPVIAFDVGGIRQWLKNGENGILVPPGNVDKLAESIRSLLSNDVLYDTLSRGALKTAAMDYCAPFADFILTLCKGKNV